MRDCSERLWAGSKRERSAEEEGGQDADLSPEILPSKFLFGFGFRFPSRKVSVLHLFISYITSAKFALNIAPEKNSFASLLGK